MFDLSRKNIDWNVLDGFWGVTLDIFIYLNGYYKPSILSFMINIA